MAHFLLPLVTTGEAFSELWPIITAMGSGYAALLGLIYKLMQDRITDCKEDIRLLREDNENLRNTIGGFNTPLAALADNTRETNRALEKALDAMLPRARGGD